ncbi:hypothetical protein V8B97DRAFT_1864657 [Scleroderma yunnanense]
MLTVQEAQDIVSQHEKSQASVTSVVEVGNIGFSYTASTKVYDIVLASSSAHYLILTFPLVSDDADISPPTGTITLPALSAVLSQIVSSTDVPVPKPVAQDFSGGQGRWNFGWLLVLVPESSQSASLASLRSTLSSRQLARIELLLGTYLRALHGVANDWFGRPAEPSKLNPPSAPFPPSLYPTISAGQDTEEDWSRYSWQDTFVLLLEDLLTELSGEDGRPALLDLRNELGIDVEELRRCLSRAIGAFLFDDVEVPGLIWVTGNEADVFVSLSTLGSEEEAEADIAYLLPTFSHTLWGDPLMEAWFVPPGPSKAVTEGYFGGVEGGRLILFPRQKTKRLWYTVYLALLVLAEERRGHESTQGETSDGVVHRSEVEWAKEILPKCLQGLKDAPCY